MRDADVMCRLQKPVMMKRYTIFLLPLLKRNEGHRARHCHMGVWSYNSTLSVLGTG